jgi:hypothetical protein
MEYFNFIELSIFMKGKENGLYMKSEERKGKENIYEFSEPNNNGNNKLN